MWTLCWEEESLDQREELEGSQSMMISSRAARMMGRNAVRERFRGNLTMAATDWSGQRWVPREREELRVILGPIARITRLEES